MRKPDRLRIDWMPGQAAQDALKRAAKKYPQLRQQDLIDRLVICGTSALEHVQWTPPPLCGRNRFRW